MYTLAVVYGFDLSAILPIRCDSREVPSASLDLALDVGWNDPLKWMLNTLGDSMMRTVVSRAHGNQIRQ